MRGRAHTVDSPVTSHFGKVEGTQSALLATQPWSPRISCRCPPHLFTSPGNSGHQTGWEDVRGNLLSRISCNPSLLLHNLLGWIFLFRLHLHGALLPSRKVKAQTFCQLDRRWSILRLGAHAGPVQTQGWRGLRAPWSPSPQGH